MVGGKATSTGRVFTARPTTRKRAGMNGSQIPKEIGIEIETRKKRERGKAGRKGIGTKRGHGFHIATKTLKANPETVGILTRRKRLKVKSVLRRRRKREREVGRGTESERATSPEIDIKKTGTTVTGGKTKGKSSGERGPQPIF